jgi:NTE family protein
MNISNIWFPRVLVLGSGGRKGFLMLGLLLLLKNTKILDQVDTIVGVSVGAIIGLMYLVGCTVTEIIEVSLSISPSLLLDNIDVKKITNSFGLFTHDLFRNTINSKILQHIGFIPTMKQLYMMTGIKFMAGVVNISDDKEEYFSYETEPDLLVTEAVIMSMNIPFVFQKYKYKNKFYVDGGVLNTLPIDLFNAENTDILAINMSNKSKNLNNESLFFYFSKIFALIISKNSKKLIEYKSDKCKIIQLNESINKGGNMDPVGMKLSFEEKSQMIIDGYINGLTFIQDLNNNDLYLKNNIELLDISYFDKTLFSK